MMLTNHISNFTVQCWILVEIIVLVKTEQGIVTNQWNHIVSLNDRLFILFDLFNSRSPISVAAAAIYMASQASEEKRSQKGG